MFDPNVSLKRFFADGVKEDYLFLIDEAHNLVERGREMYSASLEKEAFLQMKKLLRGKREGLTKALDGCNRYLLTLKRECESGFQILPQVGGFELQLQRLSAELDKYLDDAYLAHLKSVRIVHGKGTGALRKGVHNYLRRQKHVADFHLAEFGEGDAGVTIVEFKK